MTNVKLTQKPVVAIDTTTQFAATKLVNGVREVVQIAQSDLKGLDGKSSIASITGASPANIPAVGQQVQYAVDNSAGFVVDQIVAVGTASTLKVVGLPTATSILLENVDATPGVVATGTKIVPSASRGLPGTPGAAGVNAFTTVTTQFTIPAFNTNVTVTVGSTAFMSDGMALQISGIFFRVASIITTTQVSLTNTLGSQTGTIAATSKVVVAGEPGSSAFTTVTNQFTIPALNANVTATVGTTTFMSDGLALQIGGKFFRVASIISATQVSLTNTLAGQTGTIAAASKVVVAGEPGPAGTSGASGGATGLQFTYVNTAGTPSAGQLRSADITIAGTVSISATDAQSQSAADILSRLKVGAIVEISKDGANRVRATVTTDYSNTTNSFNLGSPVVYGTISNNNTVFLSIFSDAPSTGSGGGGGITFTESTAATVSPAANTGVLSNTSTRQTIVLPTGTTPDINAVQGKGSGGWQFDPQGALITLPDGTSNTGLRNDTTLAQYASVELIRVDSGRWVVNKTNALTALQLFAFGGATYDPSSVAIFNAVTTAGGTLTNTQKTNIDTVILGLKANSQAKWNKISGLYLFIGTTAATQAINGKAPGTNNLTFTGSAAHGATGYSVNGSSQYADTGIFPPSSRRGGLSLSYSSMGTGVVSGAIAANGNQFYVTRTPTTLYSALDSTTETSQAIPNAIAGSLAALRDSDTQYKTFRDGVLSNTIGSTANTAAQDRSIIVGGLTAGVSLASCTFSMVTIFDGFTDAELSELYALENAYRFAR